MSKRPNDPLKPATVGPATVGIDIGTTAIKAVAADQDGNILASCRRPHRLLTPTADRFEHDAAEAWHNGTLDTWRQVAAGLDIRGVCVAAFVPSLAGLGPDNLPVTPGLLYGDVRGASPDKLSRQPIDSGEFQGFLEWLAAAYPQAEKFCPAQAVGNAALCDEPVLDTATAMTALPVFDGVGWDEDVCRRLGISPAQLPRLSAGNDPAGEVSSELAAICHNPDAPIVLSGGTIDALAEQLMAGADRPGDVLVVLGATLLSWAVVDSWVEVDQLWTVPHTEDGLSLIGGPSNAGGIFVNYLSETLGLAAGDTGTDDPGAGGAGPAGDPDAAADPDNIPVWLPYIRGERTPLHSRDLRASLHGLNLTHGPPELLRAGHETSGFVIRHHLELAAPHCRPTRIVASGGGIHNPDWLQAVADATGLVVECSAHPQGAALGAAFLAQITAGLKSDVSEIKDWQKTGQSFEPRDGWQQACSQRYGLFKSLTYAQ